MTKKCNTLHTIFKWFLSVNFRHRWNSDAMQILKQKIIGKTVPLPYKLKKWTWWKYHFDKWIKILCDLNTYSVYTEIFWHFKSLNKHNTTQELPNHSVFKAYIYDILNFLVVLTLPCFFFSHRNRFLNLKSILTKFYFSALRH